MKKLFVFLVLIVSTHPLIAAEGAKHFPGIFLGYTDFDSETEFTFGAEYEYKYNKHWGAGGVVERIPDAHKGDGVTIWALMGFYHPVKSVKLGLGIGQERIGGDYDKQKDLVRITAAYEYKLTDRIEIAPTISVDFIDGEEAYVFGIAFIHPF